MQHPQLRQDAELLVAHAHLNPPPAAESSLVPNRSEAARRYRRLVNQTVPQAAPGGAERRLLGNLSEVQAWQVVVGHWQLKSWG